MAEGSITSAVALPDPEPRSTSPENSRKRRQSLREDRSSEDGKRRRLSAETQNHLAAAEPKRHSVAAGASIPAATATTTDARPNRKQTAPEDERKRSRRLFGSLLGTLSQAPSTAAQQRRADIERKQQAKLKSQEAEYDEGRRKKLEDLATARRKEQRVYERSAMELRHSNMLAMAHSLKTRTEPVLYYKPWQLRPEEESRIAAQIQETKTTIAKEAEEFNRVAPTSSPTKQADEAPEPAVGTSDTKSDTTPAVEEAGETETEAIAKPETVGAPTNEQDHNNQPLPHAHPDAPDAGTNDPSPDNHAAENASKSLVDESEEVMLEDKEDTVIY